MQRGDLRAAREYFYKVLKMYPDRRYVQGRLAEIERTLSAPNTQP